MKARLTSQGNRYGFFQAVRLIKLLARREAPERDPWDALQVRPTLSLAFPDTDIERIEELPERGMRITANFLGLYGVSSPLPAFYTEDLLDQDQLDKTAARQFLDVLNQSLYALIFDAWAKYRAYLRVVEEEDAAALDRLYALLGLRDGRTRSGLPHAAKLIRYIGLFTQFPRSAMGLQALLADALGEAPVEVESCLLQRLRVPADQRLILGVRSQALGAGAVLGQEVDDRMASILIRVGPLDGETFRELLPHAPQHNWLRFLVRFYLIEPLTSQVELVLGAGEVHCACLGGERWNRLGLDTWTFAGEWPDEVRARFNLYQ